MARFMLRLIFAAAVVLQISLQVQSLMETSDAEQSPWEQTLSSMLVGFGIDLSAM